MSDNPCQWDDGCDKRAIGNIEGAGFVIPVCAEHARSLMKNPSEETQ